VGLHVPVGRVWHPPQLGDGPPFDAVIAEQSASGAIVEVPVAGTVATVGSLTLEVLAPRRIYASPNDGSLVVRLVAVGIDVLFSGDVEAIAQADLGPLPATVLKVPHQGAATSDLDWITASAPAIAVISVGPNDFGHPSPEVVAALQATGAVVYRTDHHGTVRLRLDRLALPSPR
jgi:competence protein ComEC